MVQRLVLFVVVMVSPVFAYCLYAEDDLAHIGDGFYYNEQWDEAIEKYKELLSRDKNQPEIYVKLGNAYHKKGEHEMAVEAFITATQLKPDYAVAYRRWSEVSAEIIEKRRENPVDAYLKKVRENPGDAEAHFQLGLLYYKRNIHDDAKREFEVAVKLDPEKAEAYYNLGVLYQDFNSHDKAAEMYKKAVEIMPEYDKAHFNLGIAFYRLGKLDEAISAYRRVIQINPEYADVYTNLGIVYFVKGLYRNALVALQKAVRREPDNSRIHYFLGNVYKEMGELTEATNAYKKAVEIDPGLIAVRYNLGLIYLRQNKLDMAVGEFTMVISLDHDYADAYLNRAKAYELKGDKTNAQRDYDSYRHASSAFNRIYRKEIRSPYYEGSNSVKK